MTVKAQTTPVNDKYQTYWTKIEKAQKAGLPKSALNESRAVLKQAKMDRQGPAMLKSLMLIVQLQQEIAPDSTKYIFQEIEALLTESQDPVFKSVLHSVLAEQYNHYYQRERWSINQRTAIAADNSGDISEWTSARFIEVIARHIKLSLQNPTSLSTIGTDKYALV